MDVEGSTSELANRGRSEEETAQLRNIPRLFSKYSKIPNKATSKRSTSIRWQLLKYLEITNNGEHFNENIFEFCGAVCSFAHLLFVHQFATAPHLFVRKLHRTAQFCPHTALHRKNL